MATTDSGLVLAELDPYDKAIREDEGRSIEARWDFGRVLRAQIPVGKKQLPKDLRAQIAEKYKLEASEITRRMQLAEKFKTQEEVVDACTRRGWSWRRMIREELPKSPRGQRETAWEYRAKAKLDKLMGEAGESDERRDELVALLRSALRTLGADAVEVAA